MRLGDIQEDTEGALLCDIIPAGSLTFTFAVPLVQIFSSMVLLLLLIPTKAGTRFTYPTER